MVKRIARLTGITFLLLIGLSACKDPSAENQYAYLYKDLAFDMPVLAPPVFHQKEVKITDFGGIGNGANLNTEAFKKAMEYLSEKGGGRLIVPAGVWFTGPIEFKSNICLHLEERAIILFSPNKELYPIVETSFEGLDTRRCQSPISGRGLENIAITGNGAIDGNGQHWRPVKRQKVTEKEWKENIARGGVFKRDDYWMPSAAYLHADTTSLMNVPVHLQTDEEWQEIRDFLRPVMVSFIDCKNVFLQGIIFQNSPAWNLHPLMCENVIIDGIQVRNPSYAQNGDGIDLESCKNAIIVNSTFDVGDDGICIKSGKDEDGRKRAMPCENVIVDNCTVFKGHGGFVVGSEMSGGVYNISVTNCQFLGTDVGLRFKSTRGRGGVVKNIHIANISMFDIATEPILFNLYYGGKSAVEALDGKGEKIKEPTPQVSETTPQFKDIYVKNLICSNARRAMYFHGLPEQQIENIRMEDMVIHSKLGAEIIESKNIYMQNVHIFPKQGPALYFCNVRHVDVEGFETDQTIDVAFQVEGENTENVNLPETYGEKKLKLANYIQKKEVTLN